jgi:hypothetical protein
MCRDVCKGCPVCTGYEVKWTSEQVKTRWQKEKARDTGNVTTTVCKLLQRAEEAVLGVQLAWRKYEGECVLSFRHCDLRHFNLWLQLVHYAGRKLILWWCLRYSSYFFLMSVFFHWLLRQDVKTRTGGRTLGNHHTKREKIMFPRMPSCVYVFGPIRATLQFKFGNSW